MKNTNSKSIRAIDVIFTDDQPGGNGDRLFQSGEIMSASIVFMNYLSPTRHLTIQLESRIPFAIFQNSSFNVRVINTLQEFNNFNNKFTFQISNSTPQNSSLSCLLRLTNGSYNDFQWLEIFANLTYALQSGNNV